MIFTQSLILLVLSFLEEFTIKVSCLKTTHKSFRFINISLSINDTYSADSISIAMADWQKQDFLRFLINAAIREILHQC